MSRRVTRGVYRALLRAVSACERERVPLTTWRADLLALAGAGAAHVPVVAPPSSDAKDVRATLRAAFRQPLAAPGDDGAALDAAFGALRSLGTRRKSHADGGAVAESTSCSRVSHGITCAVQSRVRRRGMTSRVRSHACSRARSAQFVTPLDSRFLFAYSVEFVNNGATPVQLATRHWAITAHHQDGTHTTEHVHGPGVVGEHPKLLVGERFKYQSQCLLNTPRGTMHGEFEFVSLTGDDTVRRQRKNS